MRVLSATSDKGSSKGHSHHHHHPHPNPQNETSEESVSRSTAVEPVSSSEGLRSRGKSSNGLKESMEGKEEQEEHTQKEANASLKLSAYLNLFGDFSESFTQRL